jgi:hypothetical protein
MAFEDDLRNFLETRLLELDPAMDLSPNSPAQLKVITPILERFGQDPFATDIPTFIRDRLIQEFPEMAADSGGMVEDILSKPSQLLLEPFKRQIELVQLGGSFQNAAVMSEAEADAIGANWFTDRDTGDFSSGPVRLFYAQPTTVRCGTDKRFFTGDGKAYFPIQNYSITAQQMAFNRQGNFYFFDVTVRAEQEGDEYNVAKGVINGVEEMPGVIKVANLTDFVTGDPKETNTEYISRIENSLTDRSFVTKRGILARVPSLFDGVRALQMIGAGEDGMNRDILTGTGQGFLHLAGKATIYGDWIWLSQITYRDDGPSDSITPQPGDTLRFHPTSPAPAATSVVEAEVVTILLSGPDPVLLLLDTAPYSSGTQEGAFALLKPGTISISGVPGGISANIEVADNTIHLGGHTDVFVRPTQDSTVQTTIQNITDDDPIAAIIDLTVPTAGQNLVRSTSSDFIELEVKAGDLLVIDTGAGFAGTYQILEVVDETDLRVSSIFSLAMATELRARIVRNIRLDIISPKIPKLPFTNSPVADLQTNVGSNEFLFASINIQDYAARVGDTVNILEGPDAGEFTIIGFGPVAGSVLTDRVATATGANLSYEVYTKQDGLDRPIVRLKGIEVLDSTGQATGITVPYGDAVDIRSDCDLEGAGHDKTTYDKQLIIFPDMPEWISGGLTADPVLLGSVNNTTDARYTLGLAPADGVIRKVFHHASNQIETTEINVPPFLWNGRRDKIIALVSRTDPDFPSSIGGVHKSSDLADAKKGDSLTIHDGPNQGKYLILDHRVLELWGKEDQGHRKVALLQIDPPLKVDPIRTALELINEVNGSDVFDAEDLYGFLQFAADWDNASGFYAQFISELRTQLSTIGVTFADDAELKEFFDPLVRSSYSVGPSARGTFRTFFLEPVSAEFYFGEDPTTFELASNGSKSFRIDPDLEPAQIIPESVISTAPSLWNRNLGVREIQDEFAFLTSGTSFPVRGVKAGDVLEIYPAINDLPARGSMTSSWMCVTQSGSNIVQLILPQSNNTQEEGYGGADNFVDFAPGQLFFIDSGPDIGAFVITKILEQDWVSNPPVIRVQLDQTLTHTTNTFPVLSTTATPPAQADFNSNLPAFVQGSDLTFPLSLNGKHLEIDVSIDGGATFTTVEHTFVAADPYADMDDVLDDINADSGFIAVVTPTSNEDALVLVSPTAGPRTRVRISSSPTSVSAHTTLGLTNGTIGAGVRGAGTLPGTKKLYGSGLIQIQVDDWITLYAAKGGTVISDGDDIAVIGTYRVSAVGADQASAPFWSTFDDYIELDRTANFPSGVSISVRWIRHEEPDTEPANTSGGGKEISDQFIRFRAFDSISKKLEIIGIPWATASVHPLLDTSEQQIELESPGVIDIIDEERNYAHKAPYRILRPDVLRISSTEMAEQRDGALWYIDIPVVGYGPGEEMNVSPEDGFILRGNRKVDGYTTEVSDENFSYSMEEELHVVLPNSVLPVGASAELDNLFNLSGQNLQITYNNAPLVEDLQTLFDAPLDRVTAASMLVRHFLPGYVIFDAVYSGGASEDLVAVELIKYINGIDPDLSEIRTDLLQDVIKRKGAGTADLPLTVIVLFHGIDRSIRGMRSTKSIGIGDVPFFQGTFKQTYFIAGPDTSDESTRPVGEQVFLRRT